MGTAEISHAYSWFDRAHKMPKRYQCEFCQKSFQDTPVARRRHLQGAGHQRNRRLHYESFAGVRRERAEVLYSELSGEGILQQWLSIHPEVLERYEEKGRGKEGEGGEEGARGTAPAPEKAPSLAPARTRDLPLYLEPYRSVLPPSLMPPSRRTSFPHSLLPDEVSGWG